MVESKWSQFDNWSINLYSISSVLSRQISVLKKTCRQIICIFKYLCCSKDKFLLLEYSVYSEAGDQVTDKRKRLDPEKVNKMMVLESFYKFT